MQRNAAGNMIVHWWQELLSKHPFLELPCYALLPNHFHGILRILPSTDGLASLSSMMGWFKSMTTNAYIKGVKQSGWRRFRGRLWQRGFHDHIIRTRRDLEGITQYVQTNPARWHLDHENDARTGLDDFDDWMIASSPDEERRAAT